MFGRQLPRNLRADDSMSAGSSGFLLTTWQEQAFWVMFEASRDEPPPMERLPLSNLVSLAVPHLASTQTPWEALDSPLSLPKYYIWGKIGKKMQNLFHQMFIDRFWGSSTKAVRFFPWRAWSTCRAGAGRAPRPRTLGGWVAAERCARCTGRRFGALGLGRWWGEEGLLWWSVVFFGLDLYCIVFV